MCDAYADKHTQASAWPSETRLAKRLKGAQVCVFVPVEASSCFMQARVFLMLLQRCFGDFCRAHKQRACVQLSQQLTIGSTSKSKSKGKKKIEDNNSHLKRARNESKSSNLARASCALILLASVRCCCCYYFGFFSTVQAWACIWTRLLPVVFVQQKQYSSWQKTVCHTHV